METAFNERPSYVFVCVCIYYIGCLTGPAFGNGVARLIIHYQYNICASLNGRSMWSASNMQNRQKYGEFSTAFFASLNPFCLNIKCQL